MREVGDEEEQRNRAIEGKTKVDSFRSWKKKLVGGRDGRVKRLNIDFLKMRVCGVNVEEYPAVVVQVKCCSIPETQSKVCKIKLLWNTCCMLMCFQS